MTWLQAAVYGLLAGFSAPTPTSPEAHTAVMGFLLGESDPFVLPNLVIHGVTLAVMLTACRADVQRLLWAYELSRRARRGKAMPPDLNSINTVRLLRTAGFMTVLGTLLSLPLGSLKLWAVTIPLALCGMVLLSINHFPTGNKDGRHLLRLDGFLLGLGAMCSAVPGISLVAMVCSIASIRGASRSYGLRFAWMLLMMRLVTLLGLDLLSLVFVGADWSLRSLAATVVSGIASALGAWLGVWLLRGLSRSTGVDGFCYYNWGMALIALGLYLFA